MMHQKAAVIDLGTNTFHLLISKLGKDSIETVYKEKLSVKIGKGGINSGTITDEAIERAMSALAHFKNVIIEHQVDRIYATATSAFRNASNGAIIVNMIKSRFGIEVDVISGIEEAELIYGGVKQAMNIGNEKHLIVDIGGGSVEFIIANQHQIFWLQSVEIGAQRLFELFHQHDPIHKSDIKRLDEYLNLSLHHLIKAIVEHKPTEFIGCSGTFDTLVDIHFYAHHKLKPEQAAYELSKEHFKIIHENLIIKDKSERLLIPGMIAMRADMIVVACCLIDFCLRLHQFDTIKVSTYALKEGVLARIFEKSPIN